MLDYLVDWKLIETLLIFPIDKPTALFDFHREFWSTRALEYSGSKRLSVAPRHSLVSGVPHFRAVTSRLRWLPTEADNRRKIEKLMRIFMTITFIKVFHRIFIMLA